MTKEFVYYLTTRGLNADGVILPLEYVPDWFMPRVVVVSSKANKKEILAKYPKVGYWSNPDSINTATRKRSWIFEESKTDNFFLMNDEIRLYVAVGNGKTKSPREAPEAFRKQLQNLEDLTNYYAGVAIRSKLFCQGVLATQELLQKNYLPGLIFYWNRKLMLERIKRDRVSFGDFIDYLMQTLKLGYRTCNFAGIMYDHKTTTMQRQHHDRTVKTQAEATRLLVKYHPESISFKKDYDPTSEVMSVSTRPSKAYRPKRTVVVLYKTGHRQAIAASLILMKKDKRTDVKYLYMGEPKSVGITDEATQKELAKMGYPSYGLNRQKAYPRYIKAADHVFIADDATKKMLRARAIELKSCAVLANEPRKIETQMLNWIKNER